mgnify:CR=1 FL=1
MNNKWLTSFINQHSKHPENTKIVNDELRTSCPFHKHEDRHPSFAINLKTYKFNCKGCGYAGQSLDLFIAITLRISRTKAKEIIGEANPITPELILEEMKSIDFSPTKDNKPIIHKELILPPKANDNGQIFNYFISGRTYEFSYEDTKRIIEAFQLYYCDSGYYRNRIICPVLDSNQNIVYFTNRAIDNHPKKTLFPSKEECPNGIGAHFLGEHLEQDSPIVVEGPFDLFRLISWGYQAISPLHCLCSEEQLANMASRYTSLTLCLDSDQAGLKGTRQILKRAYDLLPIDIIILPEGKDPDDLTITEFNKEFKNRITLTPQEIKKIRL